jgi:hypothetical protein
MTGQIRWSHDSIRVGGLSAAGQRLIVLSESGRLIIAAASPRAFKLLASHQVLDGKCWTVPVLSHGRVYCRSADGQLACVDLRQ